MAVDTQRKTLNEDADIDTAVLKTSATSVGNVSRRGGAVVRETPRSSSALKAKQLPVEDPSDTNGDAEAQQLQVTVSQFIETVEVQAGIVFLVVLDLCSTVLSRHLRMAHELLRLEGLVTRANAGLGSKSSLVDLPVTTTSPLLLSSVALRLLDSLSGFTIVFFVLELAVLAFTFRRRFFSHFGYMLDLTVVCACVGIEIYTESQAIRLLGLLRVWRVFRLVGTLLERERRLHDITQEELELEKTRVLQLHYEKQAAEQSLNREYESRTGIERMLQGYKDEADTLREALNIAALAVAEATNQTIPEATEETTVLGEEASVQQVADESTGEYEHYYQDAHGAPDANQGEELQQYDAYWSGDQGVAEGEMVDGASGPVEQDNDGSDDEGEDFMDATDT